MAEGIPNPNEDLTTFYQVLPASIVAKMQRIKLVVLDVDGTLTDGAIIYNDTSREYKNFNCKDGMGVSLLIKAGIEVALLTGRYSHLTTRRAADMLIEHVIQGERNKEEALQRLMQQLNVTDDELAVVGDDINDMPVFQHAAVSGCPLDGYHFMQTQATVHLTRNGGNGAVREFADLILMAKGLMTPEGDAQFLRERGLSFAHTRQ